jgi:hypothetical protein
MTRGAEREGHDFSRALTATMKERLLPLGGLATLPKRHHSDRY